MKKYSVVDLFAGAGGLSLGFAQTLKYDIKVAFENNPDMQLTYRRNHPNVEVQGDVCKADYKLIQEKYGEIDVVIGGPPCQGFSNANRQRNHIVSKNNMLVKQYIRAILELQPKAFVMENVSMLKSDVHRFYLNADDIETVEQYSIPVKNTRINLIDEEFAFQGALDIIRNQEQVERYMWPDEHYNELNVIYKASKNTEKMKKTLTKHKKILLELAELHNGIDINDHILYKDNAAFSSIKKYFNGKNKLENLKDIIAPAIMIQRMLITAKEIFENNIVVDSYLDDKGLKANIRSYAVYDYLKNILESPQNGYVISGDVLCAADYGAPQKRMRFVVMGIKKDISDKVVLPKGQFAETEYRTVQDAIEDLEDVDPIVKLEDDIGITLKAKELGELGTLLRDSKILYNHIITNSTETAKKRFKALEQGQNFHSLDESMKTNTYTDISRTQNTVYLRLKYTEPSGTVVNVRKSMWIHPTLDRAISVREAARLQTFPDSFVFCGSKDKQYQQVGNAVPPIMALAIAKALYSLLKARGEK